MATSAAPPVERYAEALGEYLRTHGEAALYRASLLSQQFVEGGIGPEDIIALHVDGLQRAIASFSYREQARASGDALQFLLEVMIAYGIQYRDHMDARLEAQARLAQVTAAADAQREQEQADLLAIVAHELGTPLTAARGCLDYARRLLAHGELERVPKMLGTAREALDRLTVLTNELVEASRGAQQELAALPVDVERVLHRVVGWSAVAAADQGIALHVGPLQEGVVVIGDEEALLKVFNNLLANAVRYTPAGGRVTVRQQVADGWVSVEVEDTGIGMTAEEQARIFDKFYRSSDARRAHADGLRLGLTLVQRHVGEHGGRIEVASVPGQGSTFRVVLPCQHPPTVQSQASGKGDHPR